MLEYNGSVKITEKGKVVDANEYADAVVYFIPDNPIQLDAKTLEPKQMVMQKKSFVPRVLPVQAGTEISFPNFDPILHNAFSTSPKNKFDLGLYGGGDEKSHIFAKPGLTRVYCNVHHDMVAYILSFDTPYFTMLEHNGDFKLENLPSDSGQIILWHPRAKAVKHQVDLNTAIDAIVFEINLTKRRIPKHKNKLGKSYRKTKDKVY
ncbi:MAG: hypothetical protein AAF410_04295 [Pseudomonadota bacterium]